MSFPAYSERKDCGISWLGSLPSHWRLKQLKHVAAVIPSNVDKHSKDGETSVSLCNYTDVYYRDRITDEVDFMQATASRSEIHRFRLLADDVVVTKDSETADDIGVPSYVPDTLAGVICGYHLSIIRPTAHSTGRFLKYVLLSDPTRYYFEISAKGLTRVGLSQDALGNTPIPTPPRHEQEVIADFLDHETARIDALIEEQQRLIGLLEEKQRSFVAHAVTKGLAPHVTKKDSGFDWLGEVPNHWDITRVKWVARLESGHTPSRSVPEYWNACNIPWVSLNDSKTLANSHYIDDTANYINRLGLENSAAHILPERTVVFTRDATIGLSAITTKPMAVSQHLIAWVCGPKVIPEFVLFVFYAMEQELGRATAGATIKTIGMPEVRRMVTPVPPLGEQREIVDGIFDELDRIKRVQDQAREMVDLMRERRAALVSSAVTGKIDVRKWDRSRRLTEEALPQAAEEEGRYG